MDGVWEELEDNTSNSWTDYTDIDEPEMDETRAYRVRAISNNDVDGEWAMTYYPQMHAPVSTVLGAPSDVMVQIDDMDPGDIDLDVTWMSGANAGGGHLVMLFNSDFTELTHTDVPTQDGMHTFMSVASGDYVVVVVSVKSPDGIPVRLR